MPAIGRARRYGRVELAAASSVDPRILAIDQTRALIDLSHKSLCELAGVPESQWDNLRRGVLQPSSNMVSRLEEAVCQWRPRPSPALADFFRTVAGLFGDAYGLEPDALFRPGQGPHLVSRCRRLAAYVITVELLVSNADLARAIGQSRQSIKQSRDQVELWRDDPAIDALLERITERVRWRGWHPTNISRGPRDRETRLIARRVVADVLEPSFLGGRSTRSGKTRRRLS